jgi:DNA-binding response OmpR family regulator
VLKKKILIIDDEVKVANVIKRLLEATGKYDARIETDGERAVSAVRKVKPDLILLDLMMSGMNGFEICKSLKSKERFSSIPIIIVSGKTDKTDKISSLDMGADDYVTKPFSIDELDARIRAVLRRSEPEGEEKKMSVGGIIEIDLMRHKVTVKGEKVELTVAEFTILQLLASQKNRVFTRNEILDYLWGGDKPVIERTIDVHITHLKGKLGKAGKFIKNIRGVGYEIDEEDE